MARKRSASSSVSRPGVSHVYAQFAADRTRKAADPPAPPPPGEAPPPPLLVAVPLGEDLLAVTVLEVTPFAREHGRHVELLGDDAEMAPEREPNALQRRGVVRNLVDRPLEG